MKTRFFLLLLLLPLIGLAQTQPDASSFTCGGSMTPTTPAELIDFRNCVREFKQSQKQQMETQIRDLRLQSSEQLTQRLNPSATLPSTTGTTTSNNSPTPGK